MHGLVIVLFHEREIFKPVVIPDVVNVMDNFVILQITANVSLHHKCVLHDVTISRCVGMIRDVDLDVPVAAEFFMTAEIIVTLAAATLSS